MSMSSPPPATARLARLTIRGAGVSGDWPLASMYTHARTLHFVDGPDEVHLRQIARGELGRYETSRPAGAGRTARV